MDELNQIIADVLSENEGLCLDDDADRARLHQLLMERLTPAFWSVFRAADPLRRQLRSSYIYTKK